VPYEPGTLKAVGHTANGDNLRICFKNRRTREPPGTRADTTNCTPMARTSSHIEFGSWTPPVSA